MMNFPGYTLLGTINLTDEEYDSERQLSVYRNANGAVFTLDAGGCICCCDLYDGVTVSDLVEFTGSAVELAELLVAEVTAIGWPVDPEGRMEVEEELRNIMRGVAGVPVAAPLALPR
jgi:hypothetical protein